MKRLSTLVVIMLLAFTAFAQKGTIYPVSGSPLRANIIKVNNSAVRFHELPDRSGDIYVMRKQNISYIQYDDNRLQTFPSQVKDSLHVGSHLKLWSVNLGNSVSLGYKNETNYSYDSRFSFGLSRQWGYQLSPGTSVYVGGEYRMYNWSSVCDTVIGQINSYTINYLGPNIGFHVLTIKNKASWFAATTFSGGLRYYDDNNKNISSYKKPVALSLAGRCSINVGGAVHFSKTIIEVGPYVEYFEYGSDGSALGYGLKVTIIN